jgi:hypothetical protein
MERSMAKGIKYVSDWNGWGLWQGTQYDKDVNVTATVSEGVKKPGN